MSFSTSSGGIIFALVLKKALNLALSTLASPAATTSTGLALTTKEMVLAILAGLHPSAWAASSTVALEESNSRTFSSKPYFLKNSFTFCIVIHAFL